MKIMGILNVTPDSFSDGGDHFSCDNAVSQAEKMIEEGADIIDIGGESTRPYSDAVAEKDEIERVVPVIRALRGRTDIPISIDTKKAAVAKEALAAGADIINDISALQSDPAMIDLVCATDCPVIIMHMQGDPKTMQIAPRYHDVVSEVKAFFSERLRFLAEKGVKKERLIIDPGIGFGKTLEHNLSLIKHLDTFASLGLPLLLGHSRKSFLGAITGRDAKMRDLPTAVIAALVRHSHVAIVRVHNVADTRDALQIAAALDNA
ncbi:MAG: dihydropteroate synthase [Desulfobacterales bacterium]|nr:MAG: dihydropteroate synthase [Desulfobacterales bacterium]